MKTHHTTVHAGALIPHASNGRKNLLEQALAMFQKVVDNGAAEFVFKISPSTLNVTVANTNTTRKCKIQVCDALGNVHGWFYKTVTTSITTTSISGTVTNVTSVNIVNGEAIIDIAAAGTYLADETVTVTVAEQEILGVTILSATSVATIVS